METTDAKSLPETLPADAKGIKKQLVVHLNYGRGAGSAAYSLHTDDCELPISTGYDTRKGAEFPRWFRLKGDDRTFTKWAEVVAAWPAYRASLATGAPK